MAALRISRTASRPPPAAIADWQASMKRITSNIPTSIHVQSNLQRSPVRNAARFDGGQAAVKDCSICEGVAHQDGVVALRAGGEQRHRRLDQLLDPPDVFDGRGRQ